MKFIRLLFLSLLFLLKLSSPINAQPRSFIFVSPAFACFRVKIWNSFDIVRDIKSLGVTDIIIIDSQRGTFFWNSKIPGVFNEPSCGKRDFLKEIVEACHKLGLNVWLALHVTEGRHIIDRVFRSHWNLYARDARGRIYKPPHLDVFNPKVKKYWYAIIDEIATRYNNYRNIKGFLWDEVWFNSSDLFGDDFGRFASFCEKEFGEKPYQEVKKKFESEYYAKFNIKDKWWRRYALFRQYANYQFIRDLSKYAKSKGFSIIHRPIHSGIYKKGWLRVSIPHRLINLVGLNEYMWTTAIKGETEIYINGIVCLYPRFSKTTWGEMCSRSFQGTSTCMFTYEWIPFQEGNIKEKHKEWTKWLVNNLKNRLFKFFKISRQWEGAQQICSFGILTYQKGLTLRYNNSQKIFENNEALLMKYLRKHWNALFVHIEDSNYFSKFKVLIAPPYVLQYLEPKYLTNLLNYISSGAYLINFTTDWSISKNDLSFERKMGSKILKIYSNNKKNITTKILFTKDSPILTNKTFNLITKYEKCIVLNSDVKILAKFKNNYPAIVFTPLGKGGIITFCFYILPNLNKKVFSYIFNGILKEYGKPVIEIDGLRIGSVLQKKNQMLISLYSPYNKLPKTGLLKVDIQRMNIHGLKFKITTLINTQNNLLLTPLALKRGVNIYINKLNQYEVLKIELVQ